MSVSVKFDDNFGRAVPATLPRPERDWPASELIRRLPGGCVPYGGSRTKSDHPSMLAEKDRICAVAILAKSPQ
jgi:hypothetical protein